MKRGVQRARRVLVVGLRLPSTFERPHRLRHGKMGTWEELHEAGLSTWEGLHEAGLRFDPRGTILDLFIVGLRGVGYV